MRARRVQSIKMSPKIDENKNQEIVIAENFINGQCVSSEVFLDSFEPGNGRVWAKIPDSDKNEVDAAVFAAKNAFSSWKNNTMRAQYLLKAADLLEQRLDDFALAESRDQVFWV